MGLCGNKGHNQGMTKEQLESQKLKSKQFDEEMRKEHKDKQQINKLLLLGAGESGKSTLFKQMITIYGEGYSAQQRKEYIPIINTNVFNAIKTLCHQVDNYGVLSEKGQEAKTTIEDDVGTDELLTPEYAAQIKILWDDPAIRMTYQNRTKFQLTDSAAYFFGRIDELCEEKYIPTEQDVLRSRVRTTGIVENSFEIDGNKFRMFDVGGQRNERKKWIHCFEGVTAVIFVAAISEYDQVLYEDESTNRIEEALTLFNQICNSKWFEKTAMILFLNKSDLFRIKIESVPLQQYFKDYEGEGYDEGCKYLVEQFLARNENDKKKVYAHVTCATDTGNITAVFEDVKEIIINLSLDEAGLG